MVQGNLKLFLFPGHAKALKASTSISEGSLLYFILLNISVVERRFRADIPF